MVRRFTLLLFTLVSFAVVESAVGTLSVGPRAGTRLGTHRGMAIAQSSSTPTAQTTTDLYIGLRGAAVETLQTQLQAEGFYDGPTDGVFGLSTKNAVLDFQAAAGIDSTGRWDEASRQALQATLASSEDPNTADESLENASSGESSETSPEEDTASDDAAATADSLNNDASGAIAPSSANQAASRTSRLTKLLLSGLGLSAIVGSFGTGFFVATRAKKESAPSAENWLAVADGPDSLPEDATPAPSPVVGPENGNSHSLAQTGHTWTLDSDQVVSGLMKVLRTSNSQGRREAIWELGQQGNSLAVQPLVDLMTEVDSKEKSLILAALSEIGMRSLRPLSHALANAIQDDNLEVRKNAIRDLSRIYDLVVQLSQLLGHAAEDEEAEVRQTARWALEQLNRIRQPQKPSDRDLSNPGTVPASDTIEFEPPDFDAHDFEAQRHQLQS